MRHMDGTGVETAQLSGELSAQPMDADSAAADAGGGDVASPASPAAAGPAADRADSGAPQQQAHGGQAAAGSPDFAALDGDVEAWGRDDAEQLARTSAWDSVVARMSPPHTAEREAEFAASGADAHAAPASPADGSGADAMESDTAFKAPLGGTGGGDANSSDDPTSEQQPMKLDNAAESDSDDDQPLGARTAILEAAAAGAADASGADDSADAMQLESSEDDDLPLSVRRLSAEGANGSEVGDMADPAEPPAGGPKRQNVGGGGSGSLPRTESLFKYPSPGSQPGLYPDTSVSEARMASAGARPASAGGRPGSGDSGSRPGSADGDKKKKVFVMPKIKRCAVPAFQTGTSTSRNRSLSLELTASSGSSRLTPEESGALDTMSHHPLEGSSSFERLPFFSTRRSQRCGQCHTCVNPQLKQACLTVRAQQEAEARQKASSQTEE